MQLRVYILYKCSKKVRAHPRSPPESLKRINQVAIFNGTLFLGSIAAFLWVLVHNAQRRRAVIADTIHLPLPGCPTIHSGVEWLQWVPATIFEAILFGFALFKTMESTASRVSEGTKISVYSLLLRDNIFYFFVSVPLHTCILGDSSNVPQNHPTSRVQQSDGSGDYRPLTSTRHILIIIS